MAHAYQGDDDETKSDMTPLIDIIFLLLIFLLLTTKFVKEEDVIHQLLPTTKGQSNPTEAQIIPETEVRFAVHPAGIDRTMNLDQLEQIVDQDRPSAVVVRCLDQEITVYTSEDPEHALGRIHTFVKGVLDWHEIPQAQRQDQPPITVHCYSGLAWSYALWVYDGAREFERTHGRPELVDQNAWHLMRELNLSPPPIRNYDERERARELRELMVVR